MKMHLLVYVMLLGGAAAHYRNIYERNLVEPEDISLPDGTHLVKCPVCEDSHPYLKNNEVCTVVFQGTTYKKCNYGTYENSKCGGRLDCYRGPNESCTEKQLEDTFNQRCLLGYACINNKCTGPFSPISSHELELLNSDSRYHTKANQLERPSALSLNYPIRMRRQA